jgi:hypothetical protein
MSELKNSVKVINNNGFYIGVKCYDWHKHRQFLPHSFLWLSEKDIFELDSISPYFKDGTLVIEDDEINEKLGYKKKNPNSITETEIKALFKLPAKKLKKTLDGVTEDFALLKIYNLAKKSNLDAAQLKVVSEITGKKISIEDIQFIDDDEDEDENNIEAEVAIEKLLKGNFMKMKSGLESYKSDEDKKTVYEIAIELKDGLSEGKKKYLREFLGKEIE